VNSTDDERCMRAALAEAEAAGRAGEVPVGAVIALAGQIVGRGHNRPIAACDPSAHAEIVAVRAAGTALANYRLTGATLYVTVEPCLMCVGAIIQARLRRVVFGCADPKAGALGGRVDVMQGLELNHRFMVTSGVCEDECRALLQSFFRQRRTKRSEPSSA
jgi:tRNA(adenine34) deaminase